MPDVAYVSRIGQRLRAEGLSVSELHQRLSARGYRVSRSALDRVVSERPTTDAYLPVLLPVLDVLELPLRDAYERVDEREAETRRRVTARATSLLRRRRSGPPEIDPALSPEVESELDAVIAHASTVLKGRHPELFDARGRPRKRAVARFLALHAGDGHDADEAAYARLTENAARVIGRPVA